MGATKGLWKELFSLRWRFQQGCKEKVTLALAIEQKFAKFKCRELHSGQREQNLQRWGEWTTHISLKRCPGASVGCSRLMLEDVLPSVFCTQEVSLRNLSLARERL